MWAKCTQHSGIFWQHVALSIEIDVLRAPAVEVKSLETPTENNVFLKG